MENEILFQAYSRKWGKLIEHGDKYSIDVLNNTAWMDSCDDEGIILMQYANIKDMNGKKLFHGDVITNGLATFTILYSVGLYAWICNGHKRPSSYLHELAGFIPKSYKWIGNKYVK